MMSSMRTWRTARRDFVGTTWRPPRSGRIKRSSMAFGALTSATYNNAVSVLKRAFDFGYRDRPVHENPALTLRCARLRKADRPKVDPFAMHDAEILIAAIHREWGEAQGNYDEFRFFTGSRPSEQIALVLSDIDLVHGFVSINKARVSGVDRDETKTSEDRRVQLETGKPFRSLHHPQHRWRKTLQSLKVRYRRPYTARQTSVSWSLMAGKNPLWVAKQHGHSIATMLRAYAAWAEDTAEVDVEAMKRSMNASEAPPTINLAVDLSVAQALQSKRALTTRPTRTSHSCANRLFRHGQLAVNQTKENLAGVEGLFGPAGLTPSGPSSGRSDQR